MISIDQALISEFIVGSFGLPVAYENEPLLPSGPHAELLVLQNDVTPLTLNTTDATDGVFRIILRYPVNTGAVEIKQKADEIFHHFRIGKGCLYGGIITKITSQQRQPGIAEEGWYKIVLTLGYRAFLPRPT